MEVHELFTELSARRRLDILKALGERPMKFTEMCREFGMTSPETSRQLSRLIDAMLIDKKRRGDYHITHLGRVTLSNISTLEFLAAQSEYFLTHDASMIPRHLLKQIDSLSRGETVTGVYEILSLMDKAGENLREYDWYMAEDFPRHFLPLLEEKLDEGVEFRVILPKDLVSAVIPTVSDKIRERVCTRVLDEVNLSVIATDSIACLALPGLNGKIDHDAVILGYDPGFKEWCRSLFDYYWGKAEDVPLNGF